jgi:small subunit ribosomal protein S31
MYHTLFLTQYNALSKGIHMFKFTGKYGLGAVIIGKLTLPSSFIVAGLDDEAKVGFHEHVFLEDQIQDFPRRGPIRHFMELVLVGLSKNPYLTAQEKRDHIDWFRQYFKDKRAVLEEALGADGLIAETKGEEKREKPAKKKTAAKA